MNTYGAINTQICSFVIWKTFRTFIKSQPNPKPIRNEKNWLQPNPARIAGPVGFGYRVIQQDAGLYLAFPD